MAIGDDPICFNPDSRLYEQHFCTATDDELISKQQKALFLVLIFGLIGLYYQTTINSFRVLENLNFKSWDFNQVTASNFTVELTITNEMWQNFKNDFSNEFKADSTRDTKSNFHLHDLTKLFKQKLIKEMVEELSLYKCETDDISIACVQFAH